MAKKAARRPAAKKPTAKIEFERRPGSKSRATKAAAAASKVRRGKKDVDAQVLDAGQKTKRGGNRIARSQKTKLLAQGGGTRFYDKNGRRVSRKVATTQKGNLRSGFQAERTGPDGRRQVLIGGGQAG